MILPCRFGSAPLWAFQTEHVGIRATVLDFIKTMQSGPHSHVVARRHDCVFLALLISLKYRIQMEHGEVYVQASSPALGKEPRRSHSEAGKPCERARRPQGGAGGGAANGRQGDRDVSIIGGVYSYILYNPYLPQFNLILHCWGQKNTAKSRAHGCRCCLPDAQYYG